MSAETDPAALADWCVAFVADMLELPPARIDRRVKFSRMGVDSAMSVQLAVALEDRLGIALSPDVIAEYPTIASLVDYLSRLPSKVGS
jgi:acyl carrier protein